MDAHFSWSVPLVRDFAVKKAAPVVQSRVPGFIWILTLIIAGGFVTLLVFLSGQKDAEPLPDLSNVKQQATEVIAPVKAATDTESTSDLGDQIEQAKKALSFYKLLTETQVEVPPSDQPIPGSDAAKDKPQSAYILQAASFRSKADAESMRAMLILEGLSDIYVEPIEVTGKGIYYRVMIGPILNRSRMNSIKDTLVDANIAPIERRVSIPASNP